VNRFDAELQNRLGALREQNMYRELRRIDSPQSTRLLIEGKSFLNFSSNDYLGLANDPMLQHAAMECLRSFGCGSGASRLVCGSLAPFHELEAELAAFKSTEAALSFPSGFAAAIGTIPAIIGRDDIVILDKLVHASIVDAARLSGAKLRVFAHNDLDDLENKLRWAAPQSASAPRSVLVVTESIFSMDGDRAPLKEIVALKEKHGAWLMVDEAHATGIHGRQGRGVADELGVSDHVEIQMGTLGKALGASGGYICGSRGLIETLINRARSFVFSTAPLPAAAAAASAGLSIIQSARGDRLRQTLQQRVSELNTAVSKSTCDGGAIVPIMIGDERTAQAAADALRQHGIYVPAIRFPTVARGAARLRVTVTASHTAEDINILVAALRDISQNPAVA